MKSKKSMYSHLLDATLEVEKKLNDSFEETCLKLDKMIVDYTGSGLEAPKMSQKIIGPLLLNQRFLTY